MQSNYRSPLGFATISAAVSAIMTVSAAAAEFPYRRNVTLSVGQSVVLKGVRGADCSKTAAPSWGKIKGRLPKATLGTFSDGGAGTTKSNSCGGVVAARGVKFTAKTKGKEKFVVYDDAISVTVK